MDLKYWAATDVGRKRTDNEDNFLIDQKLRLFVVADGMGGHSSGEVASAMAVHIIRGIVAGESELFEQDRAHDPAWHMEICMLLEYAVHEACEQIYRKGLQEPEKKGMGTTVVSLLIVGDRGYIAYVGDSRIYLLRGGIVYQLTEDHSLMNELIRQGKITEEAFDDSPYAQFKHAMTRAVGPNERVEVDTLDFDMIPGDAFLLCSDGLYEYLDDAEISKQLSLPEIKEIPGRLIDIANTGGGKDNITALVIQVPENADGSDRAAEINFTLDTLKSIPLFADLTYQQLVRIMNLTRIIPFDPGTVLCYEGQPAEDLFVILRGSVELEAEGQVFATMSQGAHFGEMALVETTSRAATATATTAGKLLVINREDFYEILRKEAPLAVKLLWAIVQELGARLRESDDAINRARLQSRYGVTPVEEIEDLSEELIVSEDSSGSMSQGAVMREPSETLELSPDELESIDEDAGLAGDEDEDELPAGMSEAFAAAESEATRPSSKQWIDPAAPVAPHPDSPLAPSIPQLVKPSKAAATAVEDDVHTRATRPIDAVD